MNALNLVEKRINASRASLKYSSYPLEIGIEPRISDKISKKLNKKISKKAKRDEYIINEGNRIKREKNIQKINHKFLFLVIGLIGIVLISYLAFNAYLANLQSEINTVNIETASTKEDIETLNVDIENEKSLNDLSLSSKKYQLESPEKSEKIYIK